MRPTTDRVKESVFNALGSLDVIEGATVLDLFAGSGALGIEALSRGAERATFVDADRRSVAAVRANLTATALAARATVVHADALTFLAAGARDNAVDLVLADPPYQFDRWAELFDALGAAAGVGDMPPRPPPPEPPGRPLVAVVESDRAVAAAAPWQVVRQRTYGSTVVTFLQFDRALSADIDVDRPGRGASADATAPSRGVQRGSPEAAAHDAGRSEEE